MSRQRPITATRTPWRPAALLACLACLAWPAAQAAPPHEHGVARLDVAADAGHVALFLEVPLDSLVGFEREPRTDAERQQVDAMLARLRNAALLFGVDPAAQCGAPRVALVSSALGFGGAPPGRDGHAELQASIDYDCKSGQRAGFVEARLFDAFPRLIRIDVQVATRRGQLKATLRRPVTRVPLAR